MSRPVPNVYREDKTDSVSFGKMEREGEVRFCLNPRDVIDRGTSPVARVAAPCEAHWRAGTVNPMVWGFCGGYCDTASSGYIL